MPIEVRWANDEQNIIQIRPVGAWTWDEYTTFNDTLSAMLDSAGHPVVVLYDAREAKIPADVFSHFEQLRNEASLVHPNSAVGVIVVSSRLVLNVIQGVLRFNNIKQPKQFFVGTLEEAEQIAAEQVALLKERSP